MYSLSTPSLVKISCEAPWAASAAQLDSEPLCRISFLRDIIDWAYLQSPSNELEARLKIAKETREALDRLEPNQPIRCFRVVHSGWVSSLPSVLWSISSLAILKLKGVVTGSDLAGIERLPHLRLLSLEGWKGLRELPVELFTAGRLEELEVRHCGLEQLPAQIACLRRLAYLILVSNAALKRLPEALFSLPDVQVRLYDCPLARPPLPPELSIEGIDRQMLSEAQERGNAVPRDHRAETGRSASAAFRTGSSHSCALPARRVEGEGCPLATRGADPEPNPRRSLRTARCSARPSARGSAAGSESARTLSCDPAFDPAAGRAS